MGFILKDMAAENHELSVNAWNWRPTLAIIESFGILDAERLEMLGYNIGTEVAKDEARAIGEKIRDEILPGLNPQSRVLYDLTVTEEKDDGRFFREKEEFWQNYNASREWLKNFSEFCRSCEGFEVY
ncbi:MAG TPA: hypothetical protein VIL74_05445 [Pyrinomonadaceae bacterium]|jgi:hypothetical protein